MSTISPSSGFDLVKQMQPSGNLNLQFLMFDHVKHIDKWTILGTHVYDSNHCKVVTIAICDMKSRGGHFPFFNNLRAAEDRMHLNNLG